MGIQASPRAATIASTRNTVLGNQRETDQERDPQEQHCAEKVQEGGKYVACGIRDHCNTIVTFAEDTDILKNDMGSVSPLSRPGSESVKALHTALPAIDPDGFKSIRATNATEENSIARE